MTDYPGDPTADVTFERLATDALDDILGLEPVDATALGDHRFDHLLPDLSAAGREEARSTLAGLEYPSIAEQLTPAYLGNGATTPDSAIAKAAKDTANFLAELGEIRKADIPDSFAPAINTSYLQRAASGK